MTKTSDTQSIFRSTHKKNYTVLNNDIINTPDLSWKAKGVLIYLLSKPTDWKTRLTDIVKHAKDGKEAAQSAIAELKKAGYLKKVMVRDESTGRLIRWETHVFETPQLEESPDSGNPDSGKPDSGKPDSGFSAPTNYSLEENTDSTFYSHLTTTEENDSDESSSSKGAGRKKEKREGEGIEREEVSKPLAKTPKGKDPDMWAEAERLAGLVVGWRANGEEVKYQKSLVNACYGLSEYQLYMAQSAVEEQVEKGNVESLQGAIISALNARDKDDPTIRKPWEPSPKWLEARQEKQQREYVEAQREAAKPYVRKWFEAAIQYGLVKDVTLDDGLYTFRPYDRENYHVCDEWEIPNRFKNFTVEAMQKELESAIA